jgi:20S proteasome alpha/beta subunit
VNTFSPEGRLFQVEYAIKAIEVRAVARQGDAAAAGAARGAAGSHACPSKHTSCGRSAPTQPPCKQRQPPLLRADDLRGAPQSWHCPLAPPAPLQLGSCSIGVRTAEGVVLGVEKRLTSPLLEQSSIEKIMEVDGHIAAAISGLTADARTLIEHARVEAANHRFTYDEPIRAESLTQSICDLAMSFGEGGEENKSKMSRPFGVSLLLAGVDEKGPQLFHTDPSGTYVAYAAQVRRDGRGLGR